MEMLKEILEEVVKFASNWGELFLSAVSLLVAVISLKKASKAEKIQNKLNELEVRIKQYEVEKIKKEQEEALLSCVEARVITVGSGKYRLKVWNSGNAPAYNVTAKFDGDPNIIIMDCEKQPYDVLEARKNYEMILIVYGESASKFKIITEWTDANGQQHSKTQMGDL